MTWVGMDCGFRRNDVGQGLPSRYSVVKVHGPRWSAVCARYGLNVALRYGVVKRCCHGLSFDRLRPFDRLRTNGGHDILG